MRPVLCPTLAASGDQPCRLEVTPVFHLNTGVFFCEDTFL
ncbi:hypothetical protein HMPREF0004_5608 [Achromobacter piechaudii ATCC 43553]|uniref:Uncharacterized protein n=1 Tax=Achromobacter piechaudii ATCC 43553 TaxID=742159 RepID=D4XJG1_9BURK|nr:hypothetical protein HMPREF0004_5608 [Achromobacter piechaudii ATCC 43553]